MARPARFSDFRYLGDRDRQIVYDCDADRAEDDEAIEAVVAAERGTVFSPDTLAEARNRCYHAPRR